MGGPVRGHAKCGVGTAVNQCHMHMHTLQDHSCPHKLRDTLTPKRAITHSHVPPVLTRTPAHSTCKHVSTHTHTCTHTQTCAETHTHTYPHTCTHTHAHAHTHAHTHTHTHAQAHTHTHTHAQTHHACSPSYLWQSTTSSWDFSPSPPSGHIMRAIHPCLVLHPTLHRAHSRRVCRVAPPLCSTCPPHTII